MFKIKFENPPKHKGPVMIASTEGGVNIEEVAAKNPDAIMKFPIDIHQGLTKEKAEEAARELGFPPEKREEIAQVRRKLFMWEMLFLKKEF